jgi:hypothetical protein
MFEFPKILNVETADASLGDRNCTTGVILAEFSRVANAQFSGYLLRAGVVQR